MHFQLFPEVHHVHLQHQFLKSTHRLTPMLFNDCLSLRFRKFLNILTLTHHSIQSGRQIVNFNLAVDLVLVIIIDPSSIFLVLLIQRRLPPIRFLKNSEKCVKMYLLDENLFSLLNLWLLLADRCIADWPVEDSVLRSIRVL